MDKTKEQNLQLAIEMERDGKAFFLKAASGSENALAKRILEELARQEDFHIERILQIYEQMKKEEPLKEWITSVAGTGKLDKVFQESLQEKAQASENDLNALRFGLEIEDKSIKYYENLAGHALDSYEKRFYLTLSHEERDHYLRIMDSIEYLSDPVGWFYTKQRSMVDGG
jgi:rubrerythrin